MPQSTRTHPKRRGALLMGWAALLPILAFAILATLAALGSYRASDEARLRDTARALATAVDAQLSTYVAALEVLATSPAFGGDFDARAFEARSRAVGELFGGWVVLLGPPPGHPVLSLSNREEQISLPAELPAENRLAIAPLLTEVFEHGRPGISDLFEGSVIRRQILTAMVPLIWDGQPTHALALSIDPSALRELLARQGLPPGTFAAIADGQLRILAHSFDPDGQRVGLRAPDWVNAAIEGKQRALVTGPGWSGMDNVYAVERLTLAPGWTVTVAQPLAAQQASAWAALRWLVAGGAALGLALAGVVWANRREALHDAWHEAEALRSGRAEVERLHAGLPAIIFLRELLPDGTNRLIYRGGDLETVTGWPAATFAGVETFQSHVDLEAHDYHAFFRRVVRDGAATIEYRMRQPDGSRRFLTSRCRVLARRQDGSCEIVGYILDVSAEREAQARAMSAARLASLGEMAAGLAHEMKQPLQAISLAAELSQIAAARGDTAEVQRRFELIVDQTQRTASLIEHMRRFARGVEDGAPLQAVPVMVAVEGALDLARSALREASISVEVDLGDPPPVVRGQEVLLEQVLSNLLLNARDALGPKPPGAPRRIRIGVAPGTEGTVRLTVADTGGGIAPDVMARLFEPFVTTKGPDKGTGLGLSICHGLVKGMGGSIDAHNDAEGAVFTITLQVAATAEAPDARTYDVPVA
jgi:C4-dicarboxylate-specific signal transduction histidine kinase